MPLFSLIQTVIARVVVGIVAILAVFGIGSISDAPSYRVTEEDSSQEIVATSTNRIPLGEPATKLAKDENRIRESRRQRTLK